MYVCIIEIFIFYIYSKNVYLSKDLVKKNGIKSTKNAKNEFCKICQHVYMYSHVNYV